jgi:UDP-N-acetylglucosamine--N-acetylmuramyl-(pentapeptide) pyrophosphoryl-undecaprenol N-acetylglucosamine transferase
MNGTHQKPEDRSSEPRTILLAGGGTGGHVFPMIAVAEALSKLAEPRLVFVGTERGLEARAVPERGFCLELMRVLPIRGGGVRGAWRGIVRALGSLGEARTLLRRHAPDIVFSVGGYAAGPVSLAARSLGIPVALLEPDSVIGLTNRLLSPFVQRAYTAFESVESNFFRRIVLRSGVPLRAGFEPRPYTHSGGALRVLVLGGSQGAKQLNDTVPRALALCKTKVRVLHQSGSHHGMVELYREHGMGDRAVVCPFIEDMPRALAEADLVISRAGAGALSEICAIGRPSILIPYPFASGDHQRHNARVIAEAQAGILADGDSITPDGLAQRIDALCQQPGRLTAMAEAARRLGRPDAAMTVARDLLELAQATSRLRSLSEAGRQGREGDGSGSAQTISARRLDGVV